MHDSTIGTHVVRNSGRATSGSPRRMPSGAGGRGSHGRPEAFAPSATSGETRSQYRQRVQQRHYVETVQHRARNRRIIAGVGIAVVVVAIAVLAGFMAFRGIVGSEMALRDSDAPEALVPVRSDEPYYALISAELGAVAQPLERTGPDVLLLARVDRANHKLALVNIPSGLQVSTDSGTKRVADLALSGDAALITGVSNFAKVDISHYVKIPEGGVAGIVDALDGVEVDIEQVIDDPHAGDVYLPVGTYTLNGQSALTYLRASNVKLGVLDQLDHQASFAALLMAKLFSAEGNFATRMDTLDAYFQTDLSLGDLESIQGWARDLSANGIVSIALPGYETEVTGVTSVTDPMFVGSSDDMAKIVSSLESGADPDVRKASDVAAADPASFAVEVQNGTSIAGAAAVTADTLAGQGFNVAKVGNAEQPIYDETLVVYKSAEGQGLGRAKAVIDALGIGRAVSGDMYYSFDTDVLLIIGTDYKPFV